jgi:hypothetical protein
MKTFAEKEAAAQSEVSRIQDAPTTASSEVWRGWGWATILTKNVRTREGRPYEAAGEFP